MTYLQTLQAKLKTLEQKVKDLKDGTKVAEQNGEPLTDDGEQQNRQREAISRAELFCRQTREAIAAEVGRTAPAAPDSKSKKLK